MLPKPQPGVMDIALYRGGQSALPGSEPVLKLSSNENPFGPPPSAQRAMMLAVHKAHLYPPTDHAALRAAIAEVHGLEPERIICGVGSDEVLQFVTQAYAGPGDEIIHTEHGFSMYPILARMAGATPVSVPERGRRVDVEAVLAAVTPRTRVALITNPGNPTGTRLEEAELARLADGLPADVVLVLDAAYLEYAGGAEGGISLAQTRPNVLMTRTFSKIYGLGGLRVGWGYGARELIDVLGRVRQPFNLSWAQLDGAEAAVRDSAWLARCAGVNAVQRQRLTEALRQLGLQVDASHTNFVLARFAAPQEAAAADAALKAERILVRAVAGYGFAEGLRITVGDEPGTGRVIAALTRWREGV